MELSWPIKLRIGAAAAIGVALIYGVAWPLVGTSVQAGDISYDRAVLLIGLAFLAGLIGYFVAWPHGREIGILAAPAGLAVWAVRSGTMASLFQLNPTVSQRQALATSLKFEPVLWLVVVAAGFAGVLLGQKVCPSQKLEQTKERPTSDPGKYLNAVVALAGSAFIAHLLIGRLAQNVVMSDNILGSVVAQPANGQIAFAVLVSFGVAAFAVKKFLNASYIWPAIATALVAAFSMHTYVREASYLAQNWPAVFFENSVSSVLPIQMVAFGTLGSVAGYWMSVRYDYWRKHEMK
ncbi:MAG: hypothetical protein JSW47_02135 [Phycisphaerales bacterium]|nr:MAG: hypothetical protein JSW47_02135 [Phycisphaerales bacterium]